MKNIFTVIILSLILTACSKNESGGGGSSGGGITAGSTQIPKSLYSDWSSNVAMPSLDLGFSPAPNNRAVMYFDLSNFHSSGGDSSHPGEIDVFIGNGIDSLECIFIAHLTGSDTSGTIQPVSFTTSGQNTNTSVALTIQQNLQTYCSSLVDLWTYSINNIQLDVCSQSQGCYTFQ